MPQGTHTHNTPAYTARSISTNSPTTLNSSYAGSYSAADLSTYPSGGVKNTSTIEDLRKNLNQLGKDFNDSIVSHQNQITKNDGDIAAIDTNLTEHATDLSAIATDLRNKAWDTITIVPGTGISASQGTSDTADDISGNPNGKNLQSDIQLDLDVASDTEIGGLLSNDNQTFTALGASNDGQPVKGHLSIDASGNTLVKDHALELGVKTHGKYVKTLTPIAGDGINVLNGDVNNGGTATIGLETLIGLAGSTFILPNSSTATGGDNGSGGILNVPVPRISANEFGQLNQSPSTMDVKSANNYDITVAANNSILTVTNGTVKQNKGENQTITINHGSVNVQADQTFTSSTPAGNSDTPHREVEILGTIGFDAYGHVDAITKRNLTYGLNSPLSADYTGSSSFDMQLPRESDFESLRTIVNNLQGDTISLGDTNNTVIVDRKFDFRKDVDISNSADFNVADTLVVDASDTNVGIGTTNPNASYKLDIVGKTKISATGTIGSGTMANAHLNIGDKLGLDENELFSTETLYIARATGKNLHFREGTNTQLFIENGGLIGIGTTSPDEKLDVRGTIQSKGTSPMFKLFDTSSSPSGGDSTTTGYNQTAIAIGNNHAFEIQTRDGDGTFVSNDYRIPKNSSGATEHQFRISDNIRLKVTDSTTTVTGALTASSNLTISGASVLGDSTADTTTVSGDFTAGNSGAGATNKLFFDTSSGRFSVGNGAAATSYDVGFRNADIYIHDSKIGNFATSNRRLLLKSGIISPTEEGANIDLYSYDHGTTAKRKNAYYNAAAHIFSDPNESNTLLTVDVSNTFVGIGTTDNSSDTIEIAGSNETFGPYEFHVAGDSKLAGDVNVTGKLAVAGISSLSGSVDYDNVSLSEVNAITMSGILDVNSNTGSSSTTSGAVQVTGGVGIGENLFVGGTLNVSQATTLSSTLQVNGNATIGNASTDSHTLQGTTTIQGDLIVGTDDDSDENLIRFNGVTDDTNTNHTVIAERSYSGNKSELLLFKGNDEGSSVGPDRIRYRAAAHVFQTYNDSPERYDELRDDQSRMTIANDGKVGIGIAQASVPLEVVTSAEAIITARSTGTSDATIHLQAGGSYISNNGWTMRLDNSDSDKLQWRSNNNQRMTLQTDGKLGIGTVSPSEKLEVNGKIKVNSDATVFKNGPTNAPLYIQKDSGSVALGLDANEIEASTNLTIRVAEGGQLSFANVNDAANMTNNSPYNVTNMIIKSDGDVGIGTTDPTEKLHVAGTIRIDGTQGRFDTSGDASDQLNRKEYIQFPRIDVDSDTSSNDGARIYSERRSAASSNAGSLILEINDDFGSDGDGFGIRNTGSDKFRNTAYFAEQTVNLISTTEQTKASADCPSENETGFEDGTNYSYQFNTGTAGFFARNTGGANFNMANDAGGIGVGNTNIGVSFIKASTGGMITASSNGEPSLVLNRNDSNGSVLQLRRSGTLTTRFSTGLRTGTSFSIGTAHNDSATIEDRYRIGNSGRNIFDTAAVIYGNNSTVTSALSSAATLELRAHKDSSDAQTGLHLSFRTPTGGQLHSITGTGSGLTIKTDTSSNAAENIKIQPVSGATTATFASTITTLTGDLKVDDTTFNVDASDDQVRIGRSAAVSGAEAAKLIIQSQASGMADTIVLANTETGATGNTIRALRGLTLASDQESSSNTSAQSVVRVTTDNVEVMRCESLDNDASHVKTSFNGLVRNDGVTTINTGTGTFNVDLRDNNIFIINVEGNSTMALQNIGSTAGASYTFIIFNGGAYDIDFPPAMLFAGGDPQISSGNGKKDLLSGVSDGTNLYCALTLNLTTS